MLAIMQSDSDKLKPWETLSDDIAFETKWFKIHKKHMRTSRGAELDFYIHDTHDSVICVCVSDDNTVLVEQQYRPAVGKVSIDYPAGGVEEDDASTEESIRRELKEETGFEARSFKRLGVIDKEPGFSTTRMHVFLAKGAVSGEADQEETESIVASFVKPAEIVDMIATGKMACTFCVSATLLAFKELGWLKFEVQ
jgi:ADP-ribose pyrophosphatase